jgi:hypothetical protein
MSETETATTHFFLQEFANLDPANLLRGPGPVPLITCIRLLITYSNLERSLFPSLTLDSLHSHSISRLTSDHP